MKFGVSAFAWTAQFRTSHLPLIHKVREYGVDGFEIPMFAPSELPVREIRDAFAASRVECTVCAILPEGINPISPDGAVRKRSALHLRECIETAAEMGAHLIAGPLFAPIGYLPGHRRTRDEWTWAVEAIQSVCESLESNAVTLALEPVNRSETFFIRTAAEAAEFCNAVAHPRVGITIDTFHLNIEEKCIASAIEALGSKLRHVHASENDRGLLGTGHIDFSSIFDALDLIEYDGYLMIEGFGYSANEMHAPGALWSSLSTSPEDIAEMGIEFLKTLASRRS